MLHEQTITHIRGLSDFHLVEYVMTGRRVYDEEPLAFAQKELDARNIAPEKLAAYRQHLVPLLVQYDAQASIDEKPSRRESILCQSCGYEVPTMFAEYNQNIGAFVLRFSTRQKGCFCKKCHKRHFWNTTLITLGAGWWGFVSFFIAPAFVLSNIITYAKTRKLQPFPRYARRPKSDEEFFAGLWRSAGSIVSGRLQAGEDAEDIARALAEKWDCTPGEMLCFIRELVRRTDPRTSLFPSQPPGSRTGT